MLKHRYGLYLIEDPAYPMNTPGAYLVVEDEAGELEILAEILEDLEPGRGGWRLGPNMEALLLAAMQGAGEVTDE